MFQDCFKIEIKRLADSFGKRFYGDERVDMIWQDVKGVDAKLFKEIIDDFVGDARFAPTRKDILVALAEKRNTHYQKEKTERSNHICGNLTPEEVTTGMQMLGQILDNNFSPEQLEDFMKKFPTRLPKCKFCNDQGEIFALKKSEMGRINKLGNEITPGEYVFRCFCEIGKKSEAPGEEFNRGKLEFYVPRTW